MQNDMKSIRLCRKLLKRLQSVYWNYYYNNPMHKKRLELKYKDHYIHVSYSKEAKQAWAYERERKRVMEMLGPRVFKLDEDF
ncbi:hypothetical protein GCM10027299_52300 [Larkinella ripae]